MARFPELPLWTDSWIADTAHLTRCERGTYLDLLVLMWRTPECRVPNDNAWLGRHLRMTPSEVVAELQPLIAEFCESDGYFLFQKRLRKEYLLAQSRKQKARGAAKSLWDHKKKFTQAYASTTTKESKKESKEVVASEPAFAGSSPTLPLPIPASEDLLKKQERNGRPPVVFECGVVRLTQKGLDDWRRAYPQLDVEGELHAVANWAGRKPNWFVAVSSYLNKRNREMKVLLEQAKHRQTNGTKEPANDLNSILNR